MMNCNLWLIGVDMKFEEIRDDIQKIAATKRLLISQKDELEKERIELQQKIIDIEIAQLFLQVVAQRTQSQLKVHIKDIVQLALDSVFPGEFDFDIDIQIKRGKTEIKLIFNVDGEEINPVDADGGGAVDIAAMALRIAVWGLGGTRQTIILDEPFHNLSESLQQSGAELIKEISNELGVQFIVITHRKEVAEQADKVFHVHQERKGKWRESIVETQIN